MIKEHAETPQAVLPAPVTDSDPRRAHIPAWQKAAVIAASAIALTACAKAEGPAVAPPDGGQSGGAGVEEAGSGPESMEGAPACPTITPEFRDGSLTAHAEAPNADEFSTNHYLGIITEVNDPDAGQNTRTVWYAPFSSNGEADITIPERVMEEIYNNDGSGITSLSVWSDVEPPAESLTPEGMPNSGIVDLIVKAAEEKGIDPSNTDELAERQDELPRYTTCSVAEWDVDADGAGSWFTASEQGLVPADSPFAPQEQSDQVSSTDENNGEDLQPQENQENFVPYEGELPDDAEDSSYYFNNIDGTVYITVNIENALTPDDDPDSLYGQALNERLEAALGALQAKGVSLDQTAVNVTVYNQSGEVEIPREDWQELV